MTDRYCVFGNPVQHSKSPLIHAWFAAAAGQDMTYEARLAPVDGFAAAVREFVDLGGAGANVTVPFKEDAFRLCTALSERARRAGAVNTMIFGEAAIYGDNTDGVGLLQDIQHNLGFSLSGKHVALLGAGGAARGALVPLLDARPASLVIANLSVEKAVELADSAADLRKVEALGYEDLAGRRFDVLINATSASLSGASLPLPEGIFAAGSLAYDMMYGKGSTPFMVQAMAGGAMKAADGLGMLVEQAAEAFALWRGVRPETHSVLARLRAQIENP